MHRIRTPLQSAAASPPTNGRRTPTVFIRSAAERSSTAAPSSATGRARTSSFSTVMRKPSPAERRSITESTGPPSKSAANGSGSGRNGIDHETPGNLTGAGRRRRGNRGKPAEKRRIRTGDRTLEHLRRRRVECRKLVCRRPPRQQRHPGAAERAETDRRVRPAQAGDSGRSRRKI
ncbi:hypothetical protein SDC9_180998 [bioreactor metagenome]|uniref:Uncharacterized protein n=1 Tax=bioreactor metagenome TaxID=1076179 RepID=A0A645H4A2_9ZZZZ